MQAAGRVEAAVERHRAARELGAGGLAALGDEGLQRGGEPVGAPLGLRAHDARRDRAHDLVQETAHVAHA